MASLTKRRKAALLLGAALFLGLLLWAMTWPQPVLPEMELGAAPWVEVRFVTYLGEDVTDRIDPQALLDILQAAKARNLWWRGYPDHPGYPPEEYRWVIRVGGPLYQFGGRHGHTFFTISLGDLRSYRTTDEAHNRGLAIEEPQKLEAALLALLSP